MNDKNNSVIRGCLSTYFQGWSQKPHNEQIRLAQNYYTENGDIPEFMYAPAPTDAPKRFGFAVTEGGILITVNTYKTDTIMLVFNEDGSIDICPTETSMSCSLFLYPDAKRMLLNKPFANAFFPYYMNISKEDFGERLYYYENGVFLPNKEEENEIDADEIKLSEVWRYMKGTFEFTSASEKLSLEELACNIADEVKDRVIAIS